jgi:hypothetical protein
MSRQWVGPVGASLVHEATRDAWQSPYHQSYLDAWIEDWLRKGWGGGAVSTPGDWKRHLWQGVRYADLYALEETGAALIESGARTFKDQPLEATDLPGTAGLVLCEHPIPMLDVHGRKYDVTAWMWTPGIDERKRPGVVWSLFTHNADQKGKLPPGMPPLSLLHISWLTFGVSPSKLEWEEREKQPDPAVLRSHRAMLLYMQAFWSFVQQRVLIVSHAQHPRHVRKRAEKANVALPALQVIRLRRADNGPVQPSDDPKHVDWRYRWIVSGHWRWWWFESEGRRRQIWVNPYVKGPDDKPLLKRKSVFAVER